MDFTLLIEEFRKAKQTRGIVADVARSLGLSHEHVRQVASGARVSPRVARALAAEKRRRDRKEQKQMERAA